MLFFLCFFFFKQKTAYDMRISDWSSDVCSSDLLERPRGRARQGGGPKTLSCGGKRPLCLAGADRRQRRRARESAARRPRSHAMLAQGQHPGDRKSVV